MLRIMDMATGKMLEDESAQYGEEVMNANWLPQPMLQLGLQPAVSAHEKAAEMQDPEEFLQRLYAAQE